MTNLKNNDHSQSVAVIGGGPAGLMAAEVLINLGLHVDLYDGMGSVGRKFLVAGKGGLNLTHASTFEQFLENYNEGRERLEPILQAFGPDALVKWVQDLGIETFVGTSGRIFPKGMKAAPILHTWLQRLRTSGLIMHTRHRWIGWDDDRSLIFETSEGKLTIKTDAVVLALGGASWPKLGSTGEWVPLLKTRGINVNDLKPSNCGFNVAWSDTFRNRFEGSPVKTVVLSFTNTKGETTCKQGEFVISVHGIEGSLIYPFSAQLRKEIEARGSAVIVLDLAPDWSETQLRNKLSIPQGTQSLTNHLRKTVHIEGVKAGLIREFTQKAALHDPFRLAASIKSLPIPLTAPRPIAEAISSAGGVAFEELDDRLMIRKLPGVFCAGEMLDWDATTGGYLITACMATGRWAGQEVFSWLNNPA